MKVENRKIDEIAPYEKNANLNILFRSIQFDTLFALKKQIKERKNGNSKD